MRNMRCGIRLMLCVSFLAVHASSLAAAPLSGRHEADGRAPIGAARHGETADPALPVVERDVPDTPLAAVWEMLEAFADRSPAGYTAWMTDDFRFDSDDPDFLASSPAGMTRDEELAFATHLFRGGKAGPGGAPLPIATQVRLSVGPVVQPSRELQGNQAQVVLPHIEAHVVLSDGRTMDLGDTRNVMLLTHTAQGWRVRRWQETHLALAALDSLASRLARAAAAYEGLSRTGADPGPQGRLALAPMADHARDALVFDVTLPTAGGTIEVFDVMGRRIARRDLSELGAGRHVVALDGSGMGAGVYWARVRQGGDAVTARIVWAR